MHLTRFTIDKKLSPFENAIVLAGGNLKNAERQYAGFGIRLVATLIDAFILMIPSMVLFVPSGGIGSIILFFLYKTIWEASRAQATPGKRAMGIYVGKSDGTRLDLRSSLIRSAVALVSFSAAFLGHLIALFTEKHQTLHDLLVDGFVFIGETDAPLLDSWMETAREIFRTKSENV